MPGGSHVGRDLPVNIKLGLIAAVALFAACSGPPQRPEPVLPEPVPEQPTAEPEPVAPTVIETAPESTDRPAVSLPAESEPEPVVSAPRPIAIVVSGQAPAYQTVAAALIKQLGEREYHVYQLANGAADIGQVFADIGALDEPLTIAVGLPAARAVSSRPGGPAVFCQVFNFENQGLDLERMKGVAAIAPLQLQVERWQELVPELRSVGAIVGPGHAGLVAEARAATASAGVELKYRVAGSDREALYTFKQLAPEIDGFWLFPDNRVLSASVIREMLSYAIRWNVQVVVFNQALLQLGALMSATSHPDDIARTALQMLDTIAMGGMESLPALTSLSEVVVDINPAVAERLRITPGDSQWRVVSSP